MSKLPLLLLPLYHFLGGIYFAIILIATVALTVISGTFIESATESHGYAAQFTYSNPLFMALLWGFFINILFSALRRWPFQLRHLPFLITHFGLLMLLGGALIKSYAGLQGVMLLTEGTGSQMVLFPDTEALHFTKREQDRRYDFYVPLAHIKTKQSLHTPLSELKIELIGYAPHSTSYLETWIKGDRGYIRGIPSFPVSDEKELAVYGQLFLEGHTWDLLAVRSNDVEGIVKRVYLEVESQKREPTLLFLQNDAGETSLYGIAPFREIFKESFSKENLHSYFAYDQGFAGYSVQTHIPVERLSASLKADEAYVTNMLERQLANVDVEQLSSPLRLLQQSCAQFKTDFTTDCITFLSAWNSSGSWLFPENMSSPIQLNWDLCSPCIKQACLFIHALDRELEPFLKQGYDLVELLETKQWPFLEEVRVLKKSERKCTPLEVEMILTLLAQQLVAVADQLPSTSLTSVSDARLLSAYCRAYEIHLSKISFPNPSQGSVTLETTLTHYQVPAPALKKVEENQPLIQLAINKKGRQEYISLSYDRFGQGLKWPLSFGDYLVRFESFRQEIPYRVRLREARQIAYANSSQPYSYESDLLITDLREGSTIETTVSMNHVYETWDGYRFYLANISPMHNGVVKQIQLVVNHDPAKYWLTYPGAATLSLGVILLFWFRRSKKL